MSSYSSPNPKLFFDKGTIRIEDGKLIRIPNTKYDDRDKVLRSYGINYSEITEYLNKSDLDFVDHVPNFIPSPVFQLTNLELRDYQQKAIQNWEKSSMRGCVILPTGAGKTAKLKVLFDNNEKNKNKKSIDLLVAVNSELLCSQIETISKDRVFTFKKDVSIKPFLEHLGKIDAEITKEKIDGTQIKLDKNNLDLISITQIAQEYTIPETAVSKIINVSYPDAYLTVGSYLISKEKINAVNTSLAGVTKFIKACTIMKFHNIPDSCHADFLSKLGYDVIWSDLDPNNATIAKK